MKARVVWLIVTGLMVMALVLASCGPQTTTTPPTTPPTTAPPTTAPPTTKPPTAEPQYGGTYTGIIAQDIQGFDEAFKTPWTVLTMHLTNEELLTGDWAKGPAGTGEVDWIYEGFILQYETNLLAESWENPEPGTFIFHIRKGVKWQNIPPVSGRELTAEDIRYSVNRVYTVPTAYLRNTTPSKIEVSAPDKYTFVLKVLTPLYQGQVFGDVSDKVRIVAKEMVDKYGDLQNWRAACGTGPYTLADYLPASFVLLKKNPDYWRNDPVHPDKRLPYIDTLKWLVITDPSTRQAALLTAKADRFEGFAWDEKDTLKKSSKDLQFKEVFTAYPYNIYPRSDKAPLSDIRVRKAMIMAIDYDKIINSYYAGNAVLGSFPVAPIKGYLDMYTPISDMPKDIKDLYTYNPEGAKKLLADAGYPTGFKTSVLAGNVLAQVDVLSLVKDMWAKVGIDLTLDVKEFAVWYTMIAGKTGPDPLTYRYCTYTSPYKLLDSRLTSEFDAAMINDPKCNEYFDKVQAAFFNPPEFNRLMKEYAQYFQSNAWVIQGPIPYVYTGYWPWVKGYHGEGPVGYSNQAAFPMYIWIDQDLKEKMTGKR